MPQYIDKDIVKAEIEGLKRNTFTNFDEGVNAAAQILLDFLDTLEVKEVDLDDKDKWKNTGGFGSTWDPDSPDYCPD